MDKPVFRVLSVPMAKKLRYTQRTLTYHHTHARATTWSLSDRGRLDLVFWDLCTREIRTYERAYGRCHRRHRPLAGNGAKRSNYVYASCELNTYNVKRSVHDTIFCMFFLLRLLLVYLFFFLFVLMFCFIHLFIYIFLHSASCASSSRAFGCMSVCDAYALLIFLYLIFGLRFKNAYTITRERPRVDHCNIVYT